MSNNDWYQTQSWYAPLNRVSPVQPQPPVAPAIQKTPKKQRKVWVPVLAVLLVLALLAGIGLPTLNRMRRTAEQQVQNQQQMPAPELPGREEHREKDAEKKDDEKNPFDFPTLPEQGNDTPDDSMPDDWMEYFENFFQETDTSSAEVNIQQGELPGAFSLQLQHAAGKDLSLQELYEKCSPSIVAISGYIDGKSGYNWGTGVVLSSDGLILTNTHVIDACDRATVTLWDDRELEAVLIGADTISDLAVLKVDAEDLIPAEFGESSSLRVGDPVAAIGNPLGDSFRSTLTHGIISAISRDISYKGRSMTLLQTNTALNEGNSGGALFNMQGQVVGITNMKMMSSYSSIEGIGFAIPSTTVRDVVNSLVRFGEVLGRPSIGITVGSIPSEASEHYKLPEGLYITDVLENSDAWAKGVRVGDVLTEVNHTPVSTTAEVTEIKNRFGVGDTLHLTIWREGEILELDVLLMETNELYGG